MQLFFFLPNFHLKKSKTEMTVGYSKTVLCTGRVYRRNVNIYVYIVHDKPLPSNLLHLKTHIYVKELLITISD